MEKTYSIYCIENKINNRKYIGCSSVVDKRIGQHFIDLKGGYHHNELLSFDFDLYGEDNFKHYVLENFTDGNKVSIEGNYINLLGSFELVGGYNLDYFDTIKNAFVKSKITSNKLSNIHKYNNKKEPNKHLIKRNLDVSKDLIFINLDTGKSKYYESIAKCSNDEIISKTSICRIVNNFPMISKDKKFIYSAISYNDFVNNYNSNLEDVLNITKQISDDKFIKNNKEVVLLNKKVIKYDIDGNYLSTFDNVKDASIELNMSYKNIHQVASYKRNKCGGFVYRYADSEKDTYYKELNLPNRKKIGKSVSKKVINPKTGEIWQSIYDAALFNNIGYSALKMQISGKNKNILGLQYLNV